MKEYEILVETINPCGGEARKATCRPTPPTRSWTGCRPKPAIC